MSSSCGVRYPTPSAATSCSRARLAGQIARQLRSAADLRCRAWRRSLEESCSAEDPAPAVAIVSSAVWKKKRDGGDTLPHATAQPAGMRRSSRPDGSLPPPTSPAFCPVEAASWSRRRLGRPSLPGVAAAAEARRCGAGGSPSLSCGGPRGVRVALEAAKIIRSAGVVVAETARPGV